jgi:hypothetical protein
MNATPASIVLRGMLADRLGIALWQADGSGPEPAAVGHRFVTPIEEITAHYYVASRDYIDPAARAGATATALRGAWPRTRMALGTAGLAAANLHVRLPLTTAGTDREGEDWFYRNDVETRYLRPQAPLPLLLNDEAVLEFAPPRLMLTEDYRGARRFADVRIALVSEPTPARAAAGAATSVVAGTLARALLHDLAGRSVRLVVDAIHLTPETFAGRGRTSGRFAEFPAARLDVVGS